MKSKALTKLLPSGYEVTPAYDVRSRRNGLIIGSVRYSFFDGQHYRFAIDLHNGMPAYGSAKLEFGEFELRYGEAPWAMPVARPAPPAPGDTPDLAQVQRAIGYVKALPPPGDE